MYDKRYSFLWGFYGKEYLGWKEVKEVAQDTVYSDLESSNADSEYKWMMTEKDSVKHSILL